MDHELIEAARRVRVKAYAPYSRFGVGAAVRVQDGAIFTGVNVENASYPLSCCAERSAIYQAVGRGYRQFLALAIVGPGPDPLPPCGGCRQVMREFGDFPVFLACQDAEQDVVQTRVADLLPFSFGAEDLHGL